MAELGTSVGLLVGLTEGVLEGLNEGEKEGSKEGSGVGASEGGEVAVLVGERKRLKTRIDSVFPPSKKVIR
jgi:hypothetical protein